MKPIQLKMTAFGPYKFTETINFEELGENRLFVISGATGAGKTTIFDGISFALYGSGSGEDRKDTKIMRSDFATDDLHTSVELIFKLHDRLFRILRQLPHVKKGNKGATGEKYEFFEIIESGELPVVERQIVSEINKKVEELMGLTQDQFSQIVMLPQGEFRKLLTSQTENKEAILRKIFKTEPYKRISERLKDKKLLTEAELKKEEMSINGYIEHVSALFPFRESPLFERLESSNFNIFQLIQALQEEIMYYSSKTRTDQITYNEAYVKHTNKLAAYHEAKALNDQFIELEDKKERLRILLEQSEEYTNKQYQLEASERAASIEAVEGYYEELKQEASSKSKLIKIMESDLTKAKEIVKQAEVSYLEELNKKETREKSVEALLQLNALLPLMEELELKRKEMLDNKKSMEHTDSQLTIKTNLFIKEQEKCTLQKEEIEKLEHLVEQLDDKVQRLDFIQKQYSLLEDYSTNEKQLSAYELQETEQQKIVDQLKLAYLEEEKSWMSNQASILAARLTEGESCPVCGSTEHVMTHVVKQPQIVNEDKLKDLKVKLNKEESSYFRIVAKKEAIKETVLKLTLQLDEQEVSGKDASKLKSELEKLQDDVQRMRMIKQKLSALKEPYTLRLLQVNELEQEKVHLETIVQQQRSQWEQTKAVYESKKKTIPTHISNLSELTSHINSAKERKKQLESAWEEVQQQLQQAKEFFAVAQLSLEHAVSAEMESQEKLEKARAQFKEALDGAGFNTFELYTIAKLPKIERELLKEQCNAYKQTRYTLTEQVNDAQERLSDKTKQSLLPLEEELVQLKSAYEEAFQTMNTSREIEKAGIDLSEKITSTSKRVSILEQQLGRILDLYDLLRGQNQMKISFERYVQMEYLEQIVQAANERLKLLSGGQYYLMRSERQEAHGKQSGLGLDVYDVYTGQTRDVKTLSGGEKFNASLCLALGMADVIQSFQGSIRMDTMFIDEGFGSLDEESLHKAIDTLIELQKSGRMIGVISHVAELKAAIPAILEVEKRKEGYSKTKFLLK